MIKRLINNTIFYEKPVQSVTAAAFIIAIAGIISRIIGLFRDRILASQFGAGDTLDVYYAAFRIPDFLYAIIITGAMGAAFIPIFTGLISKNKEKEAWELASGLLNLQAIVLGIFSLVVVIFAPGIMKLLTPGFSGEKLENIILLTRLLMLTPVIWSVSAIFGGVLTSFKKFIISSLAPIFYNLGIIIGALVFVKLWGLVGLAWGVILGVILHALIQYPSVRSSGFHFHLIFFNCLKNHDIKRVFYLMIPRSLALGVSQVNLLTITVLASTLTSGNLAIFNFANNIQMAPLGIFAYSFSVAVFPVLSASFTREDRRDFVKNFSQTFRKILFFIIPISVFMIILRAQIVRVLLGAGKFDWEDTVLTFNTMGILALSLAAQSAIPLLTRAFYALQNTKTPFFVAIFTEGANIILAILLIGRYNVEGLAIAFSITSVLNAVILYIILEKHFHGLDEKRCLKAFFKITLAAVGAGIVIQYSKEIVALLMDIDTFLGIFTQLSVSAILGSAIFIYLSGLLQIEEAHHLRQMISKRIFRIKQDIPENINQIS